jgi:RNA polymerase sigma factor (sigma-70 family)
VATTSASHESTYPHGRPGYGTAAARSEQLFAVHGRTVGILCRALLRDRGEAEDAAQQTFLSAHRALLNGTDPREPAAWLAAIARNECWARIRTRMREPLAVDDLEGIASTSDPLAEAIRRADLAAFWVAIEELPRQQRDALLLREFGGLSYDELAAALSVSGAAVESLLFRARHRLRGRLRAVYASLAGASWLDALVKLAAGGGAPVAAKVAAIGVGAAAIGGSAVVVPHVFDNHHPSSGAAERSPAAVVHVRRKAPAVTEQAIAPKAAPVQLVRSVSNDREAAHQRAAPAGRDGRDGGDRRDGGGDRSTALASLQAPASDGGSGSPGSSGSSDTGSVDTQPGDPGSGGDGSGGDGSGRDGGHGSGGGDRGGGGDGSGGGSGGGGGGDGSGGGGGGDGGGGGN